jgi:hypothetical protein
LVPAIKCLTLSSADDIATMPPSESILGYIDLAPSDSDEEHSSQSQPRGVVGCIIDLTGSEGGIMLPWRRRLKGWVGGLGGA